ncbi:MAG: AEC family transporter [Treponema sp.]|nr:AEC family transporter [Treponema sp.]
MYILVTKQLVTMGLIAVGGFIFAKIFKVNEEQRKFLSKLLLYFINPFMVVKSFNLEFNSDKLVQLGFIVLISLVIHAVMILLGILSSREQVDRLATAFTNCGFIGIPLIRGVFGDEGVFYLMGYLVVFNVLIWTYGFYIMSGSINLKKIITNPNIIAVALGILIFCSPWILPEFIARPVTMIGDLNTAISMILIGVLLAEFKPADGKIYALKIAKVSLIRLVVCALINIGILFVVYKLFPHIPDCRMLLFVVLICSMCPAATTIPGFAVLFNRNETYASLIISFTSIFCMISIPGLVAFAEFIIK